MNDTNILTSEHFQEMAKKTLEFVHDICFQRHFGALPIEVGITAIFENRGQGEKLMNRIVEQLDVYGEEHGQPLSDGYSSVVLTRCDYITSENIAYEAMSEELNVKGAA